MDLQLLADREMTLVDQIERTIRQKTSGGIRGLRVEMLPGSPSEVVLSGRAPTYYLKQVATHAVLDEVDRIVLTNDIVVD